MKLFHLIVLAIFFLVFTTNSFGDDKQFQIGFTLPLSGPFAEFGGAVQNALTLVKEEHPATLRNIQIILEDDQYNAKNAISAFRKLKDINQVQLILAWGNEPALALAPLAESEHFPLVAFGQTPSIAAGRSSVVRILGPAEEFGEPIARYLNSQKLSAVQMILVENTFYRLVSNSVEKNLRSTIAFNTLASVPASETDFRSNLLKLKKSPTDFVGVFLAPAQLIPFFKQANELQITNPIFGSTAFESKAVVSEARQLMNGAVYAHVNVDPEWHAHYFQRFGDDIQVSYAAVAYDALLTIADIINDKREKGEIGNITGQSVLEALAVLPEKQGAAGKFFSKSSPEQGRYVEFAVKLKKVVDGKVVLVN